MTSSPSTLRIGIIGLDTSHVTAFTRLLNDPKDPHYVSGGRVTVAFPGGSPDFELSYGRVEGFTKDLRDQHGVQIVGSIEAVAEQCDAILLESVDGRVHLDQFRRIVEQEKSTRKASGLPGGESRGKPVFIDKPFAVNSRDAHNIVDLAASEKIPLMSCSALRYAEGLTQVLADSSNGGIIGSDFYGPMAIQPTQPGLFWYGIHSVEMLFAVMGPGCMQVMASTNDDHDLVVGIWDNGRMGTIRGNRKGNDYFGGIVHREKGSQGVDVHSHPKPYFASLLEQIMKMFQGGAAPIVLRETLEIIRFIEAANESRGSGKKVTL